MISVGELLSIFHDLSLKNKKSLYHFLVTEFSKFDSQEYVDFVDLLKDLEDEFFYEDE
jgi:hypothetical protein